MRGNEGHWVGEYVLASSGNPYVLVLDISRRRPPDPAFSVPSQVQVLRFMIVLLIVGLISLWITRHITSPIIQLRSAATQLAGGNSSGRVSQETLLRQDELSDLGKGFNHIASQVELPIASPP